MVNHQILARFVCIVLLQSVASLTGCSARQAVPDGATAQPDLEKAKSRFAQYGVTGAFVLLTPSVSSDPGSQTRSIVITNGDDAQRRTLPASTFKILNTLIGLKTGAVKPDHVFRWDSKPRAMKDWEQDLSLTEAFRVSCIPCYQELARQVGIERMQVLVRSIGYGNAEIGNAVDNFWLEGPLMISVQEEAEFVRRVYLEDLPFDRDHVRFVKAAMKVDDNSTYHLFAKTGWANRTEPNVGWYVGWVETDQGPRFFATRVLVPGDQPKLMGSVRKQLTLELLRDVGVIH